ncbi:Pentatricopeptide repeat [Dillenia turbinata]|uniref:Pentatricopeptide repeat n=1 Tax=Dillenia turbinata TaxID=194707 RepID=A0AAN8V839_9MAGN
MAVRLGLFLGWLSAQPAIAWIQESETSSSISPHSFSVAIRDCVSDSDIRRGNGLHCNLIKRGVSLDLFACNILLNMYVKSELLCDASKLFDEMPHRNTISFVTLIQGFAQSFRYFEAVDLFSRLQREGHELNPFVFTTILKLLVSMECADFGRAIHTCIIKLGQESNAYVGTALLDAYSVSGMVDSAEKVFEAIAGKDMVSWTGMIGCYAENEFFEESFELLSKMRMVGFKPNNFTFVSLFKAAIGLEAINCGKSIHGCVLKSRYELDPYVSISLLDLYTKSEDIHEARKIFEEMPKKDVIPWSFMIARYSQSDLSKEAIELFCQMRQAFVVPNQFTLASVLQACATLECLDLGRQIHCYVVKIGLLSDVFVSNALIDVYAKCRLLECSMELFMRSPNRNDVTWNTMIVGNVNLKKGDVALTLFLEMLAHSEKTTEVTYSSALRACASLSALDPGSQIHSLVIKTIFDRDIVVANALIDMYAKCGNIQNARLVFDMMTERDEVSWNAMISGYSMHGLSVEALSIFEMMKESACKLNKLTFVGILSACSNTGLVDKGEEYFTSMVSDYGIVPCMEHYTCMVWLLGRSGKLDRAMKLIEEIPYEPSIMVWRALLGASKIGYIPKYDVVLLDVEDEEKERLLWLESPSYAVYCRFRCGAHTVQGSIFQIFSFLHPDSHIVFQPGRLELQ